MKRLLCITVSIFLASLVTGQRVDDRDFFKRNDTLFLKKSSLPFNGYIYSDSSKTLYQDGVPSIDSPFSASDNRIFWAEIIFPLERDTFTIDTRYNINPETFTNKKLFYLSSLGKSKLINIDTLNATNYSQIKIADTAYYNFFEKHKKCPIGNHSDSIVFYIYGHPNEEGMKWIKEKKAIIKSFAGTGKGGYLYLCERHNFEF